MQQQSKESNPANNAPTRANTSPNPAMQKVKAGRTYRAKPMPNNVEVASQIAHARYSGESRKRRTRLAIFLVLGVLVAGGLAAYALTIKPVVDKVGETIKEVFVTPAPVRPAPEGGPNSTPVPVVYPDWDKKEPINILLIGLDYRPQEKDSRSDTMIVVHIDPAAKTAAMLSIPRDLYVQIPGHGEDRINSAYQTGEDEPNTPGGGPGLAMSTVEHNFGIKIHYFAQVDFTGFEKVVDAMGGVTVDVQKPLVDNEYPLTNYGTTRIYIPAGLQHMDGHTALEYARSRHADSDLGRNSRQQQVLLALRQQGLNLNLISRLNDLLTQVQGAVKTDLSLTQVGSLAQLAKQIDRNSIQTLALTADMAQETILPSGADVLVPQWDIINPKVQQLFSDPMLIKEAARISVQNGTNTGGMARKVGDLIGKEGFSVVDLSSAPNQGSYPVTTIIDYTGGQKPHTVDALRKSLGLGASDVKQGDPAKSPAASSDKKPVDIAIIVGDDRLK